MSLVPTGPRLKPEVRLAQAVSVLESTLTSDQKASLRTYKSQSQQSPPDLNDVMRLTAEIDRHASGRRCLGPRLTNFLQACQQYAALGDVMVGGSQNIVACAVWSLVRMSLLMAANYSSYLEKLSVLLMKVGRSAPRYKAIGLLYPQSTALQTCLCEYFIVVVRLCQKIVDFTQKSTLGQIGTSISNAETKSFEGELDQWANSIKEEVNLQMAKRIEEEASKSSHFRLKLSKSAAHQQRLATILRVLEFCSTYDYETPWKQARKMGTTTVHHQNTQYQNWRKCAGSCTLYYTGKLGSGKSVLMANIIDDVHLHVENQHTTVCYFFCRHDITESLQARTIIGSLARQLLRLMPDLTAAAELLDERLVTSHSGFDTLFALLKRVLPKNKKAFFFLDGLDECPDQEFTEVFVQLRQLQEFFDLSLCISLRTGPNNSSKLQSGTLLSSAIACIPDENPDIGIYIEAELERQLLSGKLALGDPGLILEIRDALINGSQGMFLWAALQIESLCALKSDDAIRSGLNDLPQDLPETFRRILRRSEALAKQYQKPILGFISTSRRPLTVEELREALSVVPGDPTRDPSKLLNDMISTLACCGCLLVIDEEEYTVRFVHYSVKQFLFSGFTDFTLGLEERRIADCVVTYLSYSVFDTQVSTQLVPRVNVSQLPLGIVNNTHDSSNAVRRMALSLLRSRKRADVDLGRVLREFSSRARAPRMGFQFYSYAKSYWQYHIPFISTENRGMYDLLVGLFRRRVIDVTAPDGSGSTLLGMFGRDIIDASPLPFVGNYRKSGRDAVLDTVIRAMVDADEISKDMQRGDQLVLLTWTKRQGNTELMKKLLERGIIQPSDILDILSWASCLGHTPFVKVLVERGKVDVPSQRLYEETRALHHAAKEGHDTILELLLQTDLVRFVDHVDQYGYTPLMLAAKHGHLEVVKRLSLLGSVGIDRMVIRLTPLLLAARAGHKSIVLHLIRTGRVDVNRICNGRTALMEAVSGNHYGTALRLVSMGQANLEIKDKDGQTALSLAVQSQNPDLVDLIFRAGTISLDWKDKSGLTPLYHAVSSGSREIVRNLLQYQVPSRSECRADPNFVEPLTGRSLVQVAIEKGFKSIAILLLETRVVDIHHADFRGRTPLDTAREAGYHGIVSMIMNLIAYPQYVA